MDQQAEIDALREELEETRNDVRMHAAVNASWRAENTRLREALLRIIDSEDIVGPEAPWNIARTALEPTASNDTQEGT